MRTAYLAETAELAYNGRNERGEWGFAMGYQAQSSMIDIKGMSFMPLYKVVGPFIFFMLLMMIMSGGSWLIVTIFLQVGIFSWRSPPSSSWTRSWKKWEKEWGAC
jgi:hypothetical protein